MAEEFYGYPDVTASLDPIRLNPLQKWKNPINRDPGAKIGPGVKDEASKPRKRAGKGTVPCKG